MKTLISKIQKATFTNLDNMSIFRLDATRPYIRNGKIVGFYVMGSTCCIFTLDVIKYVFLHTFYNKGLTNIKVN